VFTREFAATDIHPSMTTKKIEKRGGCDEKWRVFVEVAFEKRDLRTRAYYCLQILYKCAGGKK
jgi:hypothetical protein